MLDSLFKGERYTTEELNARLKFFIGIVLGLTLFGIVFVVLYSLIFVTQPMNGMSPVDNKFFELIIPIATFLTGTLSGIMLAGDDKDLRAKAIDAASKSAPPPTSGGGSSAPTSGFSASANIGGLNMSYKAPAAAPSAMTPAARPSMPGTPVAAAAPAAPKMSSTGKPMPEQEEGEEL
jgi:Na+-transporting methylmalonyl-CoA/oxaloacetate decarboxylase gamma subunit